MAVSLLSIGGGGAFTDQDIYDLATNDAALKTAVDTATAANAALPATRLVSTAGGLTGGGDLTADRTITLPASLIQYATVVLSLADLLALFATPKVIVAAGAAGTFIEFLGAVVEYTKGSASFTIGTAGNMTVNYKADASGGAISSTRAATGFFDQVGTKISLLNALTATFDASALTAQPLVLTVATADMTVGTGSSGLIKVAYRVHSGL